MYFLTAQTNSNNNNAPSQENTPIYSPTAPVKSAAYPPTATASASTSELPPSSSSSSLSSPSSPSSPSSEKLETLNVSKSEYPDESGEISP